MICDKRLYQPILYYEKGVRFLGPGQDLVNLINSMGDDNITSIVGQDIVDTFDALGIAHDSVEIRNIAVNFLLEMPEQYFSKSHIRRSFYGFMSNDKLDELAQRLELSNRKELASFDPTENISSWQKYLGFFGIDNRDVAVSKADPDSEELSVEFGLFPHQRLAANRVWEKLDGGRGRVILHMPTGAGKTRTANPGCGTFPSLLGRRIYFAFYIQWMTWIFGPAPRAEVPR